MNLLTLIIVFICIVVISKIVTLHLLLPGWIRYAAQGASVTKDAYGGSWWKYFIEDIVDKIGWIHMKRIMLTVWLLVLYIPWLILLVLKLVRLIILRMKKK